jgi:hypothetical protein
MRSALVILLGVILSAMSLSFLPTPFAWIFIIWFVVLFYFTVVSKNRAAKFLCLNVGVVLLTLGAFELYLWVGSGAVLSQEVEISRTDLLYGGSDALGYALKEGTVVTETKRHQGELVYEVVYATDDHGLRIPPPHQPDSQECILFFGNSFTFGIGVNDEETMPYQVGTKLDGKYWIYNLGVGGYGPHQMLSALEHGIVDGIIDCEPRYAVYQAILEHVPRAAGRSRIDRHGPQYLLGSDGAVRFVGSYGGGKLGALSDTLWKQIDKSLLFRNLWELWAMRLSVSEGEIDLFLGIVANSRDIIESRYPGSEFHVILWDSVRGPNSDTVLKGLADRGINVHTVSDIIPDLEENPSRYYIAPPVEWHPAPSAYEQIASYVVSQIVAR